MIDPRYYSIRRSSSSIFAFSFKNKFDPEANFAGYHVFRVETFMILSAVTVIAEYNDKVYGNIFGEDTKYYNYFCSPLYSSMKFLFLVFHFDR